MDTGVNPFHPCWREYARDPLSELPGLPPTTRSLHLQFRDTYQESVEASRDALSEMEPGQLYYVVGTRLFFASVSGGNLLDDSGHGAFASTQIGCERYAFAKDAFIVAFDKDATQFNEESVDLDWISEQRWIDIVHLNSGDMPLLVGTLFETDEAMARLLASGKLVGLPAGNGVAGLWANYPMELSRFTGPPGSLVAGTCDGRGWTSYSNIDPHVCPDGGATLAGAADGFGDASFDGTSSSSPRAAGYAAELLTRVRTSFPLGEPSDEQGDLATIATQARPSRGPLSDGRLNASELHELIRKTADPALSLDALDGEMSSFWIPAVNGPYTIYAKQGYGKLTGATLEVAWQVLQGNVGLPSRPQEDLLYAQSESLREIYWNRLF